MKPFLQDSLRDIALWLILSLKDIDGGSDDIIRQQYGVIDED